MTTLTARLRDIVQIFQKLADRPPTRHIDRASRRVDMKLEVLVLPVLDVDVIVIGSPREHCAATLAEGGLRVTLVERQLGARAGRWRVALPGVHPVQDAAAPGMPRGRPCAARTKRGDSAGRLLG
jgi:hypothetical protein